MGDRMKVHGREGDFVCHPVDSGINVSNPPTMAAGGPSAEVLAAFTHIELTLVGTPALLIKPSQVAYFQ